MSTPEATFQQRARLARCMSVQSLEHRNSGTVVSDCAVLFLKLPEAWLRVFFEGGSFFWSEEQRPDGDAVDGDHAYVLRHPPKANLVERAAILQIAFAGADGAPQRELVLEFANGASLRLVSSAGRHSLHLDAPCA